jgi:hypothetical protein
MFRARLAQLALVAGLGLVSGCSACYSFSMGAPGGGGGGLFSRFHQNRNGDCGCPATPGGGCAASPCCEGPVLDGFGSIPGVPCGNGGLSAPLVDAVPPITTAPHLVPAPVAPTVPYAP